MKFTKLLALLLAGTISVVMSGCESSSDGDGANAANPNKPQKINYVNWEAVPAEFNPSTDDVAFRTDGVQKINVDAFGFRDNVEVIYSSDVSPGAGFLRVFKVWKTRASWGELRPQSNGPTLDVRSYGSYQCQIHIENANIVDLQGGCFVRLQIFMPKGAEIEIYNVGQLISPRFIPMDTETFLALVYQARRADDKFAVIESFLHSYDGTKMRPSLTSLQLKEVLHDFTEPKDKLEALRRLHSTVRDRQNLDPVIEAEFPFDREEARKIAGL